MSTIAPTIEQINALHIADQTPPPMPSGRDIASSLIRFFPSTEEPRDGYNRFTFLHNGTRFTADACKVNGVWSVSIARNLTPEEIEANWKKGISGIRFATIARANLPHWITRPAAFRALNIIFGLCREAGVFDAPRPYDHAFYKAAEAAALAAMPKKPAPKSRRKRRGFSDAYGY